MTLIRINTIRIPDDHPGEAATLAVPLNRVVSWDVLGIHSFIRFIVIQYLLLYTVCMHLNYIYRNLRPQTPKLLELE